MAGKGGGLRKVQQQQSPQSRRSQQISPGFVTQVQHRSGPLPDPVELARYDQLTPGAADRIIAMAENEQRHRTSMEQAKLISDQRHRDVVTAAQERNARSIFRSDMLGQLLGGAIALGCVAGAIYNIHMQGHWSVTIAFVSLPVVSIIKAVRSMTGPKPDSKK